MALKSDVFREMVKNEDWIGFASLITNGEYDKYSNKMKIYFWDFLCDNQRIKEIEDCLRLVSKKPRSHLPYDTDHKIMDVLEKNQNALIYAVDSKFKDLNQLAIRVIRDKLEAADYAFWPKLGSHPLLHEFMNGKGSVGLWFDKKPIFDGIMDAKMKGIEVPKALESYIVAIARKQPFENMLWGKEIPVRFGRFTPRARLADHPMNYLDRACKKDDPKMLDLTISTLGIKAFEYPLLGGFGLVDSMIARRSFNCLKEYLDKDPQFLIQPREFQEIIQFSGREPPYVTGSFKTHHPIEKWIETIGEHWMSFEGEEKEIKMMRLICDNLETLLNFDAFCRNRECYPEVAGLKKMVEDLEKHKGSEVFVYEVRSVFQKAFEKALEVVNPKPEKYPSVAVPKTDGNNVEFSSGSQ